MRTLDEFSRLLRPDAPAGTAESDCQMVRAWLSQRDVQELLAAAWDPQLFIQRQNYGLATFVNPHTGESYRGYRYAVSTRVRMGEDVIKTFQSLDERDLDEHVWEAAEYALRAELVDRALGTS